MLSRVLNSERAVKGNIERLMEKETAALLTFHWHY